MQTRIYIVTDDSGKERLIDAASPARALAHSYPKYEVRVANTAEVARLMKQGAVVETAEPAQ